MSRPSNGTVSSAMTSPCNPSCRSTYRRCLTSPRLRANEMLYKRAQQRITSNRNVTIKSNFTRSSQKVCSKIPNAFNTTHLPCLSLRLKRISIIVRFMTFLWGITSHGRTGYPELPRIKDKKPSITCPASNMLFCCVRW
jgi:hypothetical protein